MVNEGAYTGKGDSLLSKTQAGHFGIHIDEDPFFGEHCIYAKEKVGFDLPLETIKGLSLLKIERPSDHDLEMMDTLVLTSPADWDPEQI